MSKCLTLSDSSACGKAYAGYPISSEYVTVANFTDQLLHYIGDLSQVVLQFQDPSIGCFGAGLKAKLEGLRYQQSLVCSNEVRAAVYRNGCPIPSGLAPKGPLLCQSSCNAAIQSLQSVLNDPATCNPTQGGAGLIDNFRDYCTTANANLTSNGNQCIQGTNTEASFAGWRDASTAQRLCPGLSSDANCRLFLNPPTGNNYTPLIIGCVSGVIILLLAIAYFFIRKRARNSKRNSDAETELVDIDKKFHRQQNAVSFISPPQVVIPPRAETPKAIETMFCDEKMMRGDVGSLKSPVSISSLKSPVIRAKQRNAVVMNPVSPKLKPTGNGSLGNSEIASPDSSLPSGFQYVHVKYDFAVTRPDELQLQTGQKMILAKRFDDGWGIGVNPLTGQQGAFPLACCSLTSEGLSNGNSQSPPMSSKRVSSVTSFALDPSVVDSLMTSRSSRATSMVSDIEDILSVASDDDKRENINDLIDRPSSFLFSGSQ